MLKISYFFCGHMDNMSYIIHDTTSNAAIIVDPTWDIGQLLDHLNEHQLNLVGIWLTHAHYDHIFGLDDVLCDHPDTPIFIHQISQHKFEQYLNIHPIIDGDTLDCGTVSFQVIHTPGHSPDGVCFFSPGHLISGDTLFIDRCGRADLSDSCVNRLYQSLQQLKQLPDETIVYPGHNYGKEPTDTIGSQRLKNPYLLVDNEPEFIRLRMGR